MSSYSYSSSSSGPGSLLIPALSNFSIIAPLIMAGGMSSVSFNVIPALITLTRRTAVSDRSKDQRADSGRLTPQPTGDRKFNLAVPSPQSPGGTFLDTSSSVPLGYELAAQQFVALSRPAGQPVSSTSTPTSPTSPKSKSITTSLAAVSAPGLLTILSSTYLAYHTKTHASSSLSVSNNTWRTWATVATLMAVVIPLTGVAMGPLEHKIARMAGVEDRIEPFEDSPIDREVESANTEKFLRDWNMWNSLRAAVALTAGALGLWAQVGGRA